MGSDPPPISDVVSTKPLPILATEPKEEQYELLTSSSTAALITLTEDSNDPPPTKQTPSTAVFILLVLTTTAALSAAASFAFMFFSSSSSSVSLVKPDATAEVSRSLSRLQNPVVLLISSDGFRFGYQFKADTPNIRRLVLNGTEAELGLIPVFPTLTFPNHYSIATGLYPTHHGIINNYFTDPLTGDRFTMASHDPKWWLGEPLWETVANHGLKASTYFWPGSEVKKGSWDCPKDYCKFYNGSVPFDERVDTVLKYFDLPSHDIPSFMTLYFEDPDHQGHKVGPDDRQITDAVVEIDRLIGKLIRGLEDRGIFEDVNVIMVGDHGMVGTCDRKLIFLDDLIKWIEIPKEWVQSYSPVLAIRPLPGHSPRDVVDKMNKGLNSGSVNNGEYLKVFLKEDLPGRLHYSNSYLIPPVIGLVEEGFTVEHKRSGRQECGGAHGYDNAFFSMRTIFIGHGPRFPRGRKVPSFENVEIYNMVTEILNIEGAPNNGSISFAKCVLLDTS